MFNPVFVTAPLADPGAAIETARTFAGDHGVPFALYFRDETAPDLAAACTGAGLVEHWRPPLMVLDPIPASDPRPPDGLSIEAVVEANYGDYMTTLCTGFGIPPEVVAPVLHGEMLAIDGFTGLLGRTADGTPAAASGVYVLGATAGVYNVATPPEHRSKGYGAALTAAAARLGAERGATRSILQASEAGEPVYRRMGYATPDRYRQFEPAG
jgi:GNAT superfamily N-acetyltransferase